MSKETDIKDLKAKVMGLISRHTGDREFIDWLILYAKRGQEILHGGHEEPPSDVCRESRLFHNDQKVVDFAHAKHLVLDKRCLWWWIRDQHEGEIQGLPGIRGTERITNGIIVYIEKGDGTVVQGHREWFKKDKKASVKEAKPEWKPSDRDILINNILAGL